MDEPAPDTSSRPHRRIRWKGDGYDEKKPSAGPEDQLYRYRM